MDTCPIGSQISVLPFAQGRIFIHPPGKFSLTPIAVRLRLAGSAKVKVCLCFYE